MDDTHYNRKRKLLAGMIIDNETNLPVFIGTVMDVQG